MVMITEEEAIENLNAAVTKECRSLLITCDYKGKESKEVALATLEELAFNRGVKAGMKLNQPK